MAGIVEGLEVIRVVREMLGATSGLKAAPGTIRGDFSSSRQMNLVHASDGPEAAKREIDLYFTPAEICELSADHHPLAASGRRIKRKFFYTEGRKTGEEIQERHWTCRIRRSFLSSVPAFLIKNFLGRLPLVLPSGRQLCRRSVFAQFGNHLPRRRFDSFLPTGSSKAIGKLSPGVREDDSP